MTGLTPGTSYVFAAYGDAGCATAPLASTVSFTTLAAPDVWLSPARVSLAEGADGTYTVRLGSAPSDGVTVTVTSGDTGAVTVSGASATLEFTTANWNTAQTATVTAEQDADVRDESVTITHAAAGGGFDGKTAALTAVVADDEEKLAASAITHDAATLTLADHTGDWWWRHTPPAGGRCSAQAVSGATASVTGLDAGTSYTFEAYGDARCATTPLATAAGVLTTPGRVSGVTLTPGSGRLAVSWSVPAGKVTGYKVQWKSGSEEYDTSDTSTRQKTVTSGTLTTITGLTNGTAYTVRVTAYNATGDGPASAEATGTPAVTLAASAVTADGATLTIGNHSGAWYWKYTAPDGGDCSAEVAAGASTASVTGLGPGTSYTFAAYGDSQCTTTPLATAPAVLTLPGQVEGVAAAPLHQGLAVSWTARTGTVTGYKVQWKSGSDPYNTTDRQTMVTGGSSTSTTLTGLTNTTAYTVRVTAYNATGDGAASAGAPGTPAAPTLAASAPAATLTIAHWNRAWYWKYTAPAGGECSPAVAAGTSTASPAHLAPATSHTFKAYSDSQCSDSALLATAPAFVTTAGPGVRRGRRAHERAAWACPGAPRPGR